MANSSIWEGTCCGCGIFPCCSLLAAVLMCIQITAFSLPVPLQFSWYTRRAVLTGIYNTTELVMMQDSSPGFEDTWRFLENRVADAMTMSNTASQVTLGTGVHAADPFSPRIYAGTAGFSTMQIPHLLRDPLAAVSSKSINGNVFFSKLTCRCPLWQTVPVVRRQPRKTLSCALSAAPFYSKYVSVVHSLSVFGSHKCNCRKQKVVFSLCLPGPIHWRSRCPGPDGSCSYCK